MNGDQLQPEDTLDDRGVDDILDEGISPPERPRGVTAKEEPEVWEEAEAEADADILDGPVGGEVGVRRAGRLTSPDQGMGPDDEATMIGHDEGIDGAGASAEEAAMHIIDPE